jgi:hypothetical protein
LEQLNSKPPIIYYGKHDRQNPTFVNTINTSITSFLINAVQSLSKDIFSKLLRLIGKNKLERFQFQLIKVLHTLFAMDLMKINVIDFLLKLKE